MSEWWEYGCLTSLVMRFCISRVSRTKCIAFTTGHNEKARVRPLLTLTPLRVVCWVPKSALPLSCSGRRWRTYQVGLFLLALQDELVKVLGHLVGGHVLLQLLHDGDVQVPPHIQLLPDGLVHGLQSTHGHRVFLGRKSHGAGAITGAVEARPAGAGGGTWPYHVGLAQRVLCVLQGEAVRVELALQGLLLAQALCGQFLHQAGFRLRPVQDARQLLVLFFLLHDGFFIGFDFPIDGLELMLAFTAEIERGKPRRQDPRAYGGGPAVEARRMERNKLGNRLFSSDYYFLIE